jgi:hypothetical protein
MSTGQIAAPNRSISVPFAAVIVAAAFAIGTLAGFGLPRVVDSGSHNTGATGSAATVRTLPGVADNNMSLTPRTPYLIGTGAAGSAATVRTLPGVADNNMSDAASRTSSAPRAGAGRGRRQQRATPRTVLIGTRRVGSQAGSPTTT